MSEDLKHWARVSKNELIGPDGMKEYVDEPINFISNSRSCTSSSGMNYLDVLVRYLT